MWTNIIIMINKILLNDVCMIILKTFFVSNIDHKSYNLRWFFFLLLLLMIEYNIIIYYLVRLDYAHLYELINATQKKLFY